MAKTIAFIPLRGGSQSIPLKNIRLLAGKPLAHWVISAALDSDQIDKVVISTDSEEIKNTFSYLSNEKLFFFSRSEENATNEASTESAMLEYFKDNTCENVVLIQATSPLLEEGHLTEALEQYRKKKENSLLSVVRVKRFFWNDEGSSNTSPMNYDFLERPRRQDFNGSLIENGAFYITSHKNLMATKSRLSAPIQFYEMPEETYVEIDEPEDWIIVERIIKKKQAQKKISFLKKIKLFITDVDGVLTDSGMYYSEAGDEVKKFNTRDGKGLNLLQEAGIKVGILTSEKTKLVEKRSQKLKLDMIKQGSLNKLKDLSDICLKLQIDLKQVAYIGDDLNDLEVISQVGHSFCPADAVDDIKNIVDYICTKNGGAGCVREAAELILSAKPPLGPGQN